jgi:hypothetical protein
MASAVCVLNSGCLSRVRPGVVKRELGNVVQRNAKMHICRERVLRGAGLGPHAGSSQRITVKADKSFKSGAPQMSASPRQTDEKRQLLEVEKVKSQEATHTPPGRWVKGKIAALLLAALQIVTPVTPFDLIGGQVQTAEAVLTNPNTRIPKAGDVALRRAIPALNAETKKMQVSATVFSNF